ncbi:MAG TPA: DNA repair exonuclease [Candidatus Bathyarchaeota archaeon]|nr:DNA repair exonuclease [Candidatus Bathyarchaeota archaeon]HEX68771.1 DNA repair exonuclease [Candidatus Bathyarchaeota archaeon]
MKPFSFVHVADLHLGYMQYNLDARLKDFTRAFDEVVEKTLELKPDFMIIAGDIFHHARPSNFTLEKAIKNFRKLKEAEIPVLAVDGSHDAAPNIITGTILNPLHSAGLIHYLPRLEGACWENENCYIYGIPNFRTKKRTEEALPEFYKKNKPSPKPSKFNIFVFHMAVDLPGATPPYMEAEISPELIPEGFNYYAGGHVHTPIKLPFKNGILVYSGCTETVSLQDIKNEKGFYYIEVNEKGTPKLQRIKLESPRKFILLDMDFSGSTPQKITEEAIKRIKEADEEEAVIIPVIKGVLPSEASRTDVDLAKIRSAAEKALVVRPILRLTESEVPEEIVRSIFESELKDLKTKSFEYFNQIFVERYPPEKAEKMARLAVEILEPLVRKDEEKVKKSLESFVSENRNSNP